MNYINTWNLEQFSHHLLASCSIDSPVISFDIAGEGNMNFAYRLKLENNRSIIVKQAPSYCAKFPSIPAPINRAFFERKFYELVDQSSYLKRFSPQILGFDNELNIFYMNDLGEGSDYENLYDLEKIDEDSLVILCRYLNELHQLDMEGVSFDNNDMKDLNYNYIFKLPYDITDNSVDLDGITPGLNSLLKELKSEYNVIEKISELGDIYINDKKCLIHGDFYPRSWLKTESGLFIIDPEFGFIGSAEFDVGVFLAHMAMSQDFKRVFASLQDNYRSNDFSWDLALDFCAVEILRRIFYVSQLPLLNDLNFKDSLYRSSIKRLKDPEYKFKGIE